MKLHHLRNATLIIEAGENIILVDPMLGKVGSLPPFTLFRFTPKRNPIVPLPDNTQVLLEKVTHCLITHQHPDHIDGKAERFLTENNIPVICSYKDAKRFRKKGLNVAQILRYGEKVDFFGGSIIGIPARHGYGFIASPMGNVMGFHIDLPGQPSIYISADTIYTEDVDRALKELKPHLAVVACGTAQFDIGQPLLMTMEDIVQFVRNAPHKVLANHLQAVNHCPTTRKQLAARLQKEGLLEKVYIPEDGESIDII